MKEYLVETHSHTSEVSGCARCGAKEFADLFEQNGYSTVFLTNHLSIHSFRRVKSDDWNRKIDFFLNGYELAKKEAENRFNLILAMEINFVGEVNDYLVYGITEDFLRKNKDLIEMTPKTFYPLAKENGLYVIQAHPFRFGSKIVKPDYVDGYEVFNGNPRHNSNNDIAKMWAKKYEKLASAGTDFHETGDAAISGMYFSKEIKTTEDYIEALKSGSFRIKE